MDDDPVKEAITAWGKESWNLNIIDDEHSHSARARPAVRQHRSRTVGPYKIERTGGGFAFFATQPLMRRLAHTRSESPQRPPRVRFYLERTYHHSLSGSPSAHVRQTPHQNLKIVSCCLRTTEQSVSSGLESVLWDALIIFPETSSQ